MGAALESAIRVCARPNRTSNGAFLAKMSFIEFMELASFCAPPYQKSHGYQILERLDLPSPVHPPGRVKIDRRGKQIPGMRYPQCFVDVTRNGLVRIGT